MGGLRLGGIHTLQGEYRQASSKVTTGTHSSMCTSKLGIAHAGDAQIMCACVCVCACKLGIAHVGDAQMMCACVCVCVHEFHALLMTGDLRQRRT